MCPDEEGIETSPLAGKECPSRSQKMCPDEEGIETLSPDGT